MNNLLARIPTIRIASLAIFTIAFLSIIGHVERRPALYTWGDIGSMSYPTAFCFCVTSWALFVLGLERAKRRKTDHDESES